MQSNRKQFLVVIFILLTAVLSAFKIGAVRHIKVEDTRVNNFPLIVNNWHGEDIVVPKRVYDILETKNLLLRKYTDKEGDALVLMIVYSKDNPDSIHPPELCYTGGGAELLNKELQSIPTKNKGNIKVNVIKVKMKDSIAKAWYWFTAGDKIIANYYLQQFYLSVDALISKKPKGMLVRVSMAGKALPDSKVHSFIADILPVLEKIF